MSVAGSRFEMSYAVEMVAIQADCTMIRAAIQLVERALTQQRPLDDVIRDVIENRTRYTADR